MPDVACHATHHTPRCVACSQCRHFAQSQHHGLHAAAAHFRLWGYRPGRALLSVHLMRAATSFAVAVSVTGLDLFDRSSVFTAALMYKAAQLLQRNLTLPGIDDVTLIASTLDTCKQLLVLFSIK